MEPTVAATDEDFMRLALAEAELAAEAGEVPVGAVLARQGDIVALGRNRPMVACDPTAHAEVVAIRAACAREKSYRLPGTTLYVTLEPCLMCVGALVQCRVGRLVYGAREPKFGAIESIASYREMGLPHRLEIRSGLLETECSDILLKFFRARR